MSIHASKDMGRAEIFGWVPRTNTDSFGVEHWHLPPETSDFYIYWHLQTVCIGRQHQILVRESLSCTVSGCWFPPPGSPAGWLWGSVRLHGCWTRIDLGSSWHRQLRTAGLHQGQETVRVHPCLCLQRLDQRQHQEVYFWKWQNQLSLMFWNADFHSVYCLVNSDEEG